MVLFPPPFYFVFDISNLLSYIQNVTEHRKREHLGQKQKTELLVPLYVTRYEKIDHLQDFFENLVLAIMQ